MTTTANSDWKELARREGEGLVVSLFWSGAVGRARVTVVDQMFAEELHIDVPRVCALDAFYHPFAYAAGPGPCSGDAMRKSLDLQPQN